MTTSSITPFRTDLRAEGNLQPRTVQFYLNNVTNRRGTPGGGARTAMPSSFGLIQPRTVGFSVARTFSQERWRRS